NRRVDRRVVPRTAPRAAAGVAGGRHRPAQGAGALLRRFRRARHAIAVRALREPVGALPALCSLRWRRRMTIRSATPQDVDLLMSLVERLESELPALPYPEDPADFERAKVERMVADGVALLAEEDGNAVGYLLARYGDHGPTTVYVTDLWVDATTRRRGVARELLRRATAAAAERGSTHVVLDVD